LPLQSLRVDGVDAVRALRRGLDANGASVRADRRQLAATHRARLLDGLLDWLFERLLERRP
jgi:hypothetical protein